MSKTTPTIILAGTVLRAGISSFLQKTPYKVVASASRAIELEHGCALPRLVIIGAEVRNGSLDETAEDLRQLRSSFPNVKLVLILETAGIIDLPGVLALSPDGCIVNLSSGDSLLKCLELTSMDQQIFAIPKSIRAAIGSAVMTPGGKDAVTKKVESQPDRPIGSLSPRERQILVSLAEGKSNKGIARQYGLTESTVKVHLKSVLRKLGKHNRTQAAIWAIEHGLLNHLSERGRNIQDAPSLAPASRNDRLPPGTTVGTSFRL